MSKVITAEKAASLIKDGATVGFGALLTAGFPEELAIALEKRFLETGHPAGITVVHASGVGDWKTRGTQHFAHPGMVKRWIGGHCGASPAFAQMCIDGGCEAYNLPQGVVAQLWREIAAHRPGLITKIGLGTFVDPRLEGGKMNKATTEEIVKVIQIEGEEWLFYPTFKVDVAIIRGTTADENGNLTETTEGCLLEWLPLAQATKNTGGIVIAQIEYLAKNESLHPKRVRVPGVLVDHLVIADPQYHWQAGGTYFNPAYSGDIRVPMDAVPAMPLDERLIIARRAAMELQPGSIVNLGIGVPTGVAAVAGVDAIGNVNVSKFKGRAVGCGGFINITQNSKKVVYCGTFTAGGLKVAIENGQLIIKQEGKGKKYVKKVEQVTFSGAYATATKQPVLFITERAVFELQDGQLTLVEIAPGINLEKDVLAQMEFTPRISPNLKPMPADIFKPKWGKLREHIESRRRTAELVAA